MKLGHHKGTKVTEPDFWKKSLGVTDRGKPTLGAFLLFFAHISASSHFISLTSSTLCNALRKLHVQKKSAFSCIVETRPLFLRLSFFPYFWDCPFFPIFGVFHIMSVVLQLSERLDIWTRCILGIDIWRSKVNFSKNHFKWD